MSGREIFSDENFSNSIIKSTVDAWIDELVKGIKTLMFVFDVPLFVLGGGIMNDKYVTDRIAKEIHSVDRENFKRVQIKQAFFKNKAGIIGAAHTAREKLK